MGRWAQLQQLLSLPIVPGGMPGFWANLVATLVIGTVIGAVLAPRLGLRHRTLGALWLVCLLAPLVYTLSATRSTGTLDCEWGQPIGALRGALLVPGETRSNIVLTMPAGAAALLFPSGHRRLAALGAALCLPVAIEITQMLAVGLGRGCQVSDMVNNILGVLLGFWLAAGVWTLWVAWRGVGAAAGVAAVTHSPAAGAASTAAPTLRADAVGAATPPTAESMAPSGTEPAAVTPDAAPTPTPQGRPR